MHIISFFKIRQNIQEEEEKEECDDGDGDDDDDDDDEDDDEKEGEEVCRSTHQEYKLDLK